LEGLLIALLVAAVSSILGGKNKANPKKPPLNTKPVSNRKDYNNKYSSERPNVKPKQKPDMNYDVSYINPEPVTERIQNNNIKYEEVDIENEEILDIGLSDMQRAIVMTEILGKPIALRKK